MASEFHVALDWTILSVPNTICVYWRALSLLYCAVDALTSGDSTRTYGVLLTGLSLMEIPIVYFPYGHFVVVTTKVLNQAMLCVMLILVHNIREKREVPMSVRHRVCYSLLVENCAAYNLTWNYIQTVVLASAMLAQDFGVGPQAVSSLQLVLFSICVLFTMSIELVFPRTFQWTVAAHVPLQMYVFYLDLNQHSAVNAQTVCALVALNALLLVSKIIPPRKSTKYLTFSLEKYHQNKGVDTLFSVV